MYVNQQKRWWESVRLAREESSARAWRLDGRFFRKRRNRLRKKIVLLFLLGSSAWGAQVYNFLFLRGVNPGFFVFDVDGVERQLLCDQFAPNVTTLQYQAIGYSLNELASATTLALFGDPQELLKYQLVAILALQAYADPSLAPDVVRANRIIVDGSGPHTPGADALLAFVQTQNPADYP